MRLASSSGSMAFLNLIPYLCSLAGLVLWFVVLQKITTPRRAFAVMVVFGLLFNYHRFSFHFFSEALFIPLLALTLLVVAFLIMVRAYGRKWGA